MSIGQLNTLVKAGDERKGATLRAALPAPRDEDDCRRLAAHIDATAGDMTERGWRIRKLIGGSCASENVRGREAL